MKPVTQTSPPAPRSWRGAHSKALRVAVYALATCVVLALVVTVASWAGLAHATDSEDWWGSLLLLGLVTLAGGFIGLLALILALVHYGRGRSWWRTLGVLALAAGLLVAGGYIILVLTRPIDSTYRAEQEWLARSQVVEQQWKARVPYPSCGTVEVLPSGSPTMFGSEEFRCMRLARSAAKPAEVTIVRKADDATWYVRTQPDRSVEVFIHNGPLSGKSFDVGDRWVHHTCTPDRVLLSNPRVVCRGLWYYGG